VTSARPKLVAWICIAAASLGAGVLLGRPELVAFGTPFALALLAVGPPPRVAVRVRSLVEDVAEGEEVPLGVEVSGPPGATADVAVVVPPALELLEPGNPVAVRVGPDGTGAAELVARARRWGRAGVGAAVVRTAGPLGALVREDAVAARTWVKVRPDPERLRHLLQPRRTQLLPGDHPAPVVGTGVDFAALRPARAGDRVRDVSWRATARRGTPLVVERHPDRAADIVLLLDSFGEEGLDDAVRCTFALATHHLRHRDRVGLVRFGGTSRWVRPGTGLRHLHELTEALLATEVFLSWAAKRIDIVPPRMLPAAAFVVAVSPLEDERMLDALLDLRRRGVDIAAVEVPPSRWVPAATTPADVLGEKLWHLGRESLRDRFDAVGVPVASWAPGEAVETVVARLGRLRRGAA
jgi:uncharacterized protein (DUF58 family)